MVRHPLYGGACFALAALLAAVAWQHGEAGAKRSDAHVKVQAKAGPQEGGKQKVTVSLDVAPGWHIYANPVGNEDLVPAQTVVQFKADGKPAEATIDYPKGKVHKDKIVGDYHVYEDKVTITATVEGKGPLEVSVKLQACDSKRCLLPATVKVKVQ